MENNNEAKDYDVIKTNKNIANFFEYNAYVLHYWQGDIRIIATAKKGPKCLYTNATNIPEIGIKENKKFEY